MKLTLSAKIGFERNLFSQLCSDLKSTAHLDKPYAIKFEKMLCKTRQNKHSAWNFVIALWYQSSYKFSRE